MAKCNLGKVKLERVGQRSSPIAVCDMRGGHLGIPRAFWGFVASVSVLCLLCLLIIADQLCLLANCCGFTLAAVVLPFAFTYFSCSLRRRCFYIAPTIALQPAWMPLIFQVILKNCLLRRVLTPKSFALPVAMLVVRRTRLAGKRTCSLLHFWPRWSRPLNRRSQPNMLR